MHFQSYRRFYKRLPRLRPVFLSRCFIALLLLIVIWNEYLSYEFSALIWAVRLWRHDSDSVRILVVADPQLIGYQNEKGLFTGLRRWDSDRYLKNGFSRALRVTNADAVVFLGDLFDEGIEMTSEEFEWSMDRFDDIFSMPEFVQRLFIPGDNDVGGEHEAVSPTLVRRFRNRFINRFDIDKLGLNDFDVLHVNAFANTSKIIYKGTGALLLVISHVPFLRSSGSLQQAVRNLKPSLILSGHDHMAEYYQEGRTSYNFYRTSLYTHSKVVEIRVSKSDPVTEFQSPTCSYRMGVPDMGYGLLLLRKHASEPSTFFVKYFILWLPRRFLQLTFYAICAALGILFFIRVCFMQRNLEILFKAR